MSKHCENKTCRKYTSIGGQALIEGILMRGPEKTSIAVRKKDGTIDLSEMEMSKKKKPVLVKWPFVRGIFNLIESLIMGYKALMLSADKSGYMDLEEEEMSKEKQSAFMAIVGTAGTVLGFALAAVLFILVPMALFNLVNGWTGNWLDAHHLKGLFEGVLRIIIFLCYIGGVALMKDIKRVYMYHGAEHKTIFCYEAHEDLTVENVKKFKRFHPRCGTSFLFLVLLVSILVSTSLTLILPKSITGNYFLWLIIKLLCIPLICGIGYELIRLCGKHDNLFTKIISAPGLWVQRLTTKEPEDDMIEIAIAALTDVIPEGSGDQIV